uniref:Holocytochrome c-type synthase n=1 Tax=Rhabditophanes sp. KR3021 TaxID=114890 RepID=A0AC35TW29_9BILA
MSACPMKEAKMGACPVDKDGNNPLNNMPPPNQLPSPGQPFPLPTTREKSTIPKAYEDGVWEYPSPQMFWNAMIKRGWRWGEEDLTEKDMKNIINIHNINNERAWQEILKWENLLHPECAQPKLKSFKGDADKFSPKARFYRLFGYKAPFDRHDWIVDRCGEKDVRYVIDYYDNDGSGLIKNRNMTHLDVRPALQDGGCVWDRMTVAYNQFKHGILGIKPKFMATEGQIRRE